MIGDEFQRSGRQKRGVDEIVETVDWWYDASFARATREIPAKKRGRSFRV
jgi:hypothetical protein